jgi:hypothetical protein
MADQDDTPRPPERRTHARRGFFRGGRRKSDWPESLTVPLRCPRCQSAEAKFIEGTADTLFWECHRCRRFWSTTQTGEPKN